MGSTITDRRNDIGTPMVVSRRFGVNSNNAIKVACHLATTSDITLYGNQIIDGVLTATDDRILVKNQTNQTENGIWLARSVNWIRAPDFNGDYDIQNGALVLIMNGSQQATFYQLTTADPVVIGTSNVVWTLFTLGSTSAISFSSSEIPSGTINGTNVTFTLAHTPNPAVSLQLVLNGITLKKDVDYTLSTATITYTLAQAPNSAPQTGDTHYCWYRY